MFRISCCLCGKPIAPTATHHGLDREWKRRFPRLPGSLAHEQCAIYKNEWSCHDGSGNLATGHLIPDRRPTRDCLDSWDHLNGEGTQKGMVATLPFAALLQGAEEYLRYKATWRGTAPEPARLTRRVLAIWDAPDGREQAAAHSHLWITDSEFERAIR